MKSVIFCLLFLFSLSYAQTWVNSTWTDEKYGGTLSFCFIGQEVHGFYSERGLIQGSLVATNIIQGNFYEAGGSRVNCTSGTVRLTIVNGGEYFSGSYVCADSGASHDWNGQFIDFSATADSCGVVASSGSVNGGWGESSINGNWYICTNDATHTYTSSYNNVYDHVTISAAESGVTFAGGRIISGIYAEEETPYGTDIAFLAYDGSLRSYFGPSDSHYNRDTSVPTTYEIAQLVAVATQAECNANIQLITFGTFGNSTFTDDIEYGGFGGFIRLCLVEKHVHGVYSEVGLIQGELNGNKINGSFYQAGGNFVTCTSGTFEWTINIDGSGFTGYYVCSGSTVENEWRGTYVGGANTVNPDTCAVIGQGGNTAGKWTRGVRNWDICLNNDTYYSSYDYLAEPFHGYETGQSFLDGRIIAGVFAQETTPTTGISISWYTYEQRIDTFFWETASDYIINSNDLNNLARHGNTTVFRIGQASGGECLRNELVFDAGVWSNSSWINPQTGVAINFCFIGNRVFGTFGNGFAVFEGILLSNSSLSAEYYQPGAGVLPCTSGLFTANIRAQGTTFDSVLQCYGINTLTSYTAILVGGNNTVDADSCAVTVARNVTGLWVSSSRNLYTWSICTDVEFFESSYDIGSVLDGYYVGEAYKHGKILSGSYKENGTDYGVALSYHRYDGVLVTSFWPTNASYYVNPVNGSVVRTDEFTYYTTTTVDNCEHNDYLFSELSIWSSSSWRESRYGQTLYLCIIDGIVYGAYSEVGILQGIAEGNRISGNFFQGGGVLVSCSTGTFQLSISPAGNAFTGNYVCSDKSGTFTWSGVFLGGANSVNPDKCAQTSSNGNLAGSWNIGDFHWDVCFSSDAPGDYYSSFNLELSGIRGYDEGRSYLNNIIISGTYVDQVTPYGITLAWRKYNKQMGYFLWITDQNYQLNITDYENVNKHIAGSLVNTGPASSTECIKNEYIFQNGGSLWQNSSWTDQLSGLAGSVYLCVLPNNQVHGSFSEIGLLQGFVNGRTISGNFYKAGGPNIYCTSGTFQFTISDDGSTFSGSKRCVEGDSYSWNEFLLSGPSLTISQKCQVIDRGSSNQLRGGWNLVNNTRIQFEWDICYEGNSDYSSSYTRNTLEGYEYGAQWAGGDILSGINTNTLIPYAISISWINYNGELGNFFWATDDLYRVYASSILDKDEHYVSYLSLKPNVTITNEECTRNVDLVAAYGIWTNSSWTFAEFNNNGAPNAKLFICIVDGKVHGSYGEFGILQGTLSADGHRISGNFYEAGKDSFDCTVGKFSLLIDETGSFFTGYYTCADNEAQISWSETFIAGPESVNNGLCAVIDDAGTLSGQWSGPDDLIWDICIDNNKYESSFTTNLANSLGYSEGDEHRDARLLNGVVASQRYPHGVSLIFRGWDGTLVQYFWSTNANYTINIADYSDIFRHYKIVCTNVGLSTVAECDRYSYLLNDGGNNYITSADLSTDNLSSALLPALCIILLSFLLTL